MPAVPVQDESSGVPVSLLKAKCSDGCNLVGSSEGLARRQNVRTLPSHDTLMLLMLI